MTTPEQEAAFARYDRYALIFAVAAVVLCLIACGSGIRVGCHRPCRDTLPCRHGGCCHHNARLQVEHGVAVCRCQSEEPQP